METSVILLHEAKALLPIFCNDSGRLSRVIAAQLAKALLPMESSPSLNLTDANFEHP